MIENPLNCSYGFRVDVDTISGYVYGVPRLLSTFKKLGIRATFAITTGSDRTALNALHYVPSLTHKIGVDRRRTGAKHIYPNLKERLNSIFLYKTAFLKSIFPNSMFLEAERKNRIAPIIVKSGHDVILHGYNHFLWANKLSSLSYGEQEELILRGIQEFKKITNLSPKGFAAPAFKVTSNTLDILRRTSFDFCSNFFLDKIKEPFFPVVKGKKCRLEIPVFKDPLINFLKITTNSTPQETKKMIISNVKEYSEKNAIFFFLHAGVEGLYNQEQLLEFLLNLKTCFTGSPLTLMEYKNQIVQRKDEIQNLCFD